VTIETNTFVLDLTPPITCSWAIPVKVDVNNPISETYPKNKLLLQEFMALQLQSRYCQHIDDKDKNTHQYMPEIIQYIKSTLGDHLNVPDTLLSVIFGDDVHDQYDRGDLYLSIAYISFLKGDPRTSVSHLTGTCGTLSGRFFIRILSNHIRTSLRTDPPIDCDDFTPLSARAYCFYHYSNRQPLRYFFAKRSYYLSSMLSFLHMVSSDQKGLSEELAGAVDSTSVDVAYEEQYIRHITRLPFLTLNPYDANEQLLTVSFNTGINQRSVHRNLHNFDEISRFLRPNVWLVPSISNFPTFDLIGMSNDHEIVAIQITTSTTHRVKQTDQLVSAIKAVVSDDRLVSRVCIVICSPKQPDFRFSSYVTLVATLRTHMSARVNVSLHHYPFDNFDE
jgi:hypothetical protein